MYKEQPIPTICFNVNRSNLFTKLNADQKKRKFFNLSKIFTDELPLIKYLLLDCDVMQ